LAIPTTAAGDCSPPDRRGPMLIEAPEGAQSSGAVDRGGDIVGARITKACWPVHCSPFGVLSSRGAGVPLTLTPTLTLASNQRRLHS
jgi:hypothetical protein